MKLLVFGDFHEGNHQPLARLDDFEAAKIALIQEIDEIAKSHGCRAKLQMGDFLDKPVYPHSVLMEIVKRWKPSAPAQQLQRFQNGELTPEAFLKSIKEDIPLIGVVGNHELSGDSLNTLGKTSINFLREMGFIQLVDKENPVILVDEETGQSVAITGTHYHSKMDQPAYVSDYVVEEKLGDVHIHLVHGYADVKKKPWLYTPVSNFLPDTLADVTITGHDHEGFDLVEMDGKKAFNPGAPHATKADQHKFKPKVAILDVSASGVEVTFIPLKTGSNTEEIIDRERVDTKKEKLKKMEEIKSTVSGAKISQRLTISEIIESVADNKHLDTEIKQDLVKRVEDKMGAMMVESHQTNPYHITKIIIKNFQSHKNTTIDLSPGLNVLVGESGEGKSAILRALSFVYRKGKLNPKTFIHSGEKECSVQLILSDGSSITRFVDKTGRKNGYKIFDAKTGQTHEGNTKLLPIAQQLLGYFPLAVDESTAMELNFSRQGEGWYFIGDHISAPLRAKVIGSFYQTHYADAVNKELDQESKKMVTALKTVSQQVEHLDESLVSYTYLDTLEERVAQIEVKEAQLTEQVERFERLKQAYIAQHQLNHLIKTHERAVERLNNVLEEPQKQLQVLTEKVNQFKALNQAFKQKQKLLHLATRTKKTLAQFESTEPIWQNLNRLNQAAQQFKYQHQMLHFIYAKLNQQQKIASIIQQTEWKLAQSTDTTLIWQRLYSIQALEQKEVQLRQLLRQHQESLGLGQQAVQQIKGYQQLLEQTLVQYRQLLEQLKQCPICSATISSATIDHIVATHLNNQ